MEFFSIIALGGGKFAIVSSSVLAAGFLGMTLLAIIRTIIEGAADKVYAFANDCTWIVILVIAIFSILVSWLIFSFSPFRNSLSGKIKISTIILFWLSLTISLSICYTEVIYWIGALAEKFEELFIIALIMGGFFLAFLIIQIVATVLIGLLPLSPLSPLPLEDGGGKVANILLTILGIAANGFLIFLAYDSQLPVYLLNSLS